MGNLQSAYNWMVDKANSTRVGYSKDFRSGRDVTYTEAGGNHTYASNYHKDWEYLGLSHDETLSYYDCSSSIYYALTQAGYSVGNYAFATDEECSKLSNAGFKQVSGKNLKAGDICWKSGHTAMVYQDHPKSGTIKVIHAHGRKDSGYTAFPKQFLIGDYSASKFTRYYRDYDADPVTPYEPDPDPEPEEPDIDIPLKNICAILGNYVQESTINPAQWEKQSKAGIWTSLRNGYGLGQWTNVEDGPRLVDFYNWCIDNGKSYSSGEIQLQYEFDVEKWWNTHNDFQSRWGPKSLDDFLENDYLDIEDATECYMNCWEGIRDSDTAYLEKRKTYAKKYYNELPAYENESYISKWVKDESYPGYLSESDMLNNAVLIYRWIKNHYSATTSVSNDTGDAKDEAVEVDIDPGPSESATENGTETDNEANFMATLYMLAAKGMGGQTSINLTIHRRRI